MLLYICCFSRPVIPHPLIPLNQFPVNWIPFDWITGNSLLLSAVHTGCTLHRQLQVRISVKTVSDAPERFAAPTWHTLRTRKGRPTGGQVLVQLYYVSERVHRPLNVMCCTWNVGNAVRWWGAVLGWVVLWYWLVLCAVVGCCVARCCVVGCCGLWVWMLEECVLSLVRLDAGRGT